MDFLKRLPVSKLEVGMYVSEKSAHVAGDAIRAKGLVTKAETVAKLQQRKDVEIIIDTKKGKNSRFALPLGEELDLKPKVSLAKELPNAKKVYKEAVGLVGSLLKDVKMGKPIDVTPVKTLAEDINESVLNNENALLCLSQIRAKDKYLLEHSINVGLLMGIFARHLGYEQETIHELVTGALLHDIGKIRVPNQVLNKPGKLSAEEWKEMQNHVIYGVEVLKQSKGITNVAMDICGMHHERLDGTGYPAQLDDHTITVYGRMASIVDVYDAMTADRCYHKGKSPGQAIKILLSLADAQLDKHLLHHFVNCMSIYPVGATVELSNGKIGVVIGTNRDEPGKPFVRTFFNQRHKHYEQPKVFNLASKLVDVKVEQIIEARDHNFNVVDFMV